MLLTNNVIITDIGSTTTKALLLEKKKNFYTIKGYESASTTVEKPEEDVKIGVYQAIKRLEKNHNLKILHEQSTPQCLNFYPEYTYLTTSSAGGGLQILVVGLALAESAASAERASYGVGGVLVEVLAVDDRRSSMEKIKLINSSHPDIILFCGGVDGGALFSVYRMAEILKISQPTQKFSQKSNIPLVYAGNQDAVDFIKTTLAQKYELSIVPNLRPSMTCENLLPTKEKIHELFMENVMEQAPGYAELKKLVRTNILPTPVGVLNTLKMMGKKHSSLIAFDIGGATTDVYSNISGRFFRSVSANFGMSYSLGNTLAESDYQQNYQSYFKHAWGDSQWTEQERHNYFTNYIGNKVLNPDHNPKNDLDLFLEHCLAITNIKLSLKQHFKMHFNTQRIGFLDTIKQLTTRDKWKETMYYPHYDQSLVFSLADLDDVIGAGGVISHATPQQAIFMLIESINPEGLTVLWRDKYFISPHLGVLANLDENQAEFLMENNCFEKLATYYKPPINKQRQNQIFLQVKIDETIYECKYNEVFYFCPKQKSRVQVKEKVFTIEPDYPLIIDNRVKQEGSSTKLLEAMSPYHFNLQNCTDSNFFRGKNKLLPTIQETKLFYSLPYPGTLFVKINDIVTPNTVLGENLFEPPKIFVLSLCNMLHKVLSESDIREGLCIKINDTIANGDLIYHKPKSKMFPKTREESHNTNLFSSAKIFSPLRGIIEEINYQTGTILVREIQDYPLTPIIFDVIKKLNVSPSYIIKPKEIKSYLKVKENDFIYAGSILAQNSYPLSAFVSVHSPYTGTIQKIDLQKGTVTICYDHKPFQLVAHCYGEVEKIDDHQYLSVSTKAKTLEGKIGFGREISGKLVCLERDFRDELLDNKIIYYAYPITYKTLQDFAQKNINGLICDTISYSILKLFLGKDIGVVLTGNENIPFSLIILKGFAETTESDNNEFFRNHHHHHLMLRPYTQIRAGVSRPTVHIF